MRRQLAVAAALAAATLTLAATAACAAFGPPQPLVAASDGARFAVQQLADGGSLVATLTSSSAGGERLDLFDRAPEAPFQAPRTLATGRALTFDTQTGREDGLGGFAANRSGDAALAWLDGRHVRVVTRTRGGSFGAARRLGAVWRVPGDRHVLTTVSPRGDVLVLWTGTTGMLTAALRRAGSDRFALSSLGASDGVYSVKVAVTASGFALGWSRCDRDPDAWGRCSLEAVRAAESTLDGRFGRPRTLGSIADDRVRLSLIATPQDDLLAVWSGPRSGSVATARRAAGATRFGPTRALSNLALPSHSATAAGGRSGGVVVWLERQRDRRVRVVGADFDARGRIGRPQRLSTPLPVVSLPRVRVQDDGAALVWWHLDTRDPYGGQGPWTVRSRAATQRGWSDPAELPGPHLLEIALDGHGQVLFMTGVAGTQAGSCFLDTRTAVAIWPAGSAPTPPTAIDDCSAGGEIDVDESGRALFRWVRSLEPTGIDDHELKLALRPPGGAIGPPETVGLISGLSAVSLADDGGALLVWSPGGDGALLAALAGG